MINICKHCGQTLTPKGEQHITEEQIDGLHKNLEKLQDNFDKHVKDADDCPHFTNSNYIGLLFASGLISFFITLLMIASLVGIK